MLQYYIAVALLYYFNSTYILLCYVITLRTVGGPFAVPSYVVLCTGTSVVSGAVCTRAPVLADVILTFVDVLIAVSAGPPFQTGTCVS